MSLSHTHTHTHTRTHIHTHTHVDAHTCAEATSSSPTVTQLSILDWSPNMTEDDRMPTPASSVLPSMAQQLLSVQAEGCH